MKRLIDYTAAQNLPPCLMGLGVHAQTLWTKLEGEWTIETGLCDNNAPFLVDTERQIITINDNGISPRPARGKPCMLNHMQMFVALEALRAATLQPTHTGLHSQTHPTLWPLLARMAHADRMAVVTHTIWAAAQEDPDTHAALWRAWLCGPYAPLAQIYGLMSRACLDMDDDMRMAEMVRRFFTYSDYLRTADRDALARMEHADTPLNMHGDAIISAQSLQRITPSLATGTSYLGDLADDIAHDTAAMAMIHPFDMAHMRQILAEVGTTRVGALAIRDARLAARLGQSASLTV